jgi:primosomal protein N' (replication factor Y)
LIQSSASGPRVFRVALDMPLRRVFDYLPPQGPRADTVPEGAQGAPPTAEPAAAIEPGMRVRVPFGRQRLVGVVMELAEASDVPAERLKSILEVLDPRPILDPAALGLLRWAAEYYHHPIGEVVSAALPKALRLGASSSATQERWSLTAEGREAHQRGDPKRAPKQRTLLEFLVAHEGATPDTLSGHLPNWRDAARQDRLDACAFGPRGSACGHADWRSVAVRRTEAGG